MKPDPKTVRSEWLAHQDHCARCDKYDPEHPATLANTCHRGAELIKGVLELEAAPVLAKKRRNANEAYKAAMEITGTSGRTTKQKLAAVMRYKA